MRYDSSRKKGRVPVIQKRLFAIEVVGKGIESSHLGAFEQGVRLRLLLHEKRHIVPTMLEHQPLHLEVPPPRGVHSVHEDTQLKL